MYNNYKKLITGLSQCIQKKYAAATSSIQILVAVRLLSSIFLDFKGQPTAVKNARKWRHVSVIKQPPV